MTFPTSASPSVTNPSYLDSVRGVLVGTALGDATGYPLELLSAHQISSRLKNGISGLCDQMLKETMGKVSDDTQLTFYILDGLTEVLEWNNTGAAADELACIWLALLRWYRAIGEVSAEAAPFAPERDIDSFEVLHHRRDPGMATLTALASGEMQTMEKNINRQALGSGALVRSAPVGFLPVPDSSTVVMLAARQAALTHGHPEAIISACAYALMIRYSIGNRGTRQPLLRALSTVLDWLEHPESQLPQSTGETAHALSLALDHASDQLSTVEADSLFGNCWLAPAVLGRGVLTALSPDAVVSPIQMLGAAAASGGDSDSIAAICGGLLGAAHGSAIFVADTVEKLEVSEIINHLTACWAHQLGLGES